MNKLILGLFMLSISCYSCKKENDQLHVIYEKQPTTNQDKGLAITAAPISIAVFPNPFLTRTNLLIEGNSAENVTVMLRSSDGRFQKIENPGSRLTLDFSDEPKGFYYMEIHDGINVYQKQLIKFSEK